MVKSLSKQRLIGYGGVLFLMVFLTVHTLKDLNTDVEAWYFRSTPVWLIVMGIGSAIYYFKTKALKRSRKDLKALFSKLPEE
jgi:APA family basic amino acid/polyamine antiporter